MGYKIVAFDDAEGTITYEIEHAKGVLREQLRCEDYKGKDAILARIEEREKQVCEEVGAAKDKTSAIPDEIKAMIAKG